jgi:hypothetical protein
VISLQGTSMTVFLSIRNGALSAFSFSGQSWSVPYSAKAPFSFEFSDGTRIVIAEATSITRESSLASFVAESTTIRSMLQPLANSQNLIVQTGALAGALRFSLQNSGRAMPQVELCLRSLGQPTGGT